MRIWLIVIPFLFGACSIQTVVPTAIEYRLEPHTAIQKAVQDRCAQQSIKVARLQVPDNYTGRSIYYGEGEMKQFAYAYARWAQPLNERVGKIVESSVRNSGRFGNVVSYKTLLPTDYVLQITLNDLMQYFPEEASSYVRLDMDILLLNDKGNAIADAKHITLKEMASTRDVEGGVMAMNRVLEKALAEVNIWLGGRCE